jgi:SAM-dependent methyltransferase/glycosyltransferase involved in cell wall biosynthesis
MKKNNNLLIFIDPGYLDGIGHYENYGIQLRREARRQGVTFWHMVNRYVPESKVVEYELTPFFLRPAFLGSVLHQEDELEFALKAFAAKLHLTCRKILGEGLRDNRVTMFMYTGHPNYLFSIADVLNDPIFRELDIRFYFNLFYVDNRFALKVGGFEYIQKIRLIGQELEKRDPGRRIILCADSERIANIYSPYFERPFFLIPIPLTKGNSPESDAGGETEISDITLGFLGYTHAKQGYPFINRLYYDVVESPDFDCVRLCVRHNIFNADPANAENLRDLLGKKERIENYINYLSRSEYYNLMDRCDILLIPHSQIEYPVQTSGMMVDALSRGKIVVVPENTWLSDQLSACGSGVTFSGDSYESFLEAVKKAVGNFEVLKRNRFRNIDGFSKFHCAEALFDILLSPKCADEKRPNSSLSDDAGFNAGSSAFGREKNGKIELLSMELLRRHRDTVDFIYSEKIGKGKSLGWHYLLDLTWIVEQIKDLPSGATILDAGAGLGLLQFLLLAMGHRVISVDFSPRKSPSNVPTIKIGHGNGNGFEHHYIDHLKKNFAQSHSDADQPVILQSRSEFEKLLAMEKAPLILYQADLLDMSLLSDASVDAVVSVSAIEHIDLDQVGAAVKECSRVLKPEGCMYATTSASSDGTWYHEASQGWCYDENKLREIFRLAPSVDSNFNDYAGIFDEMVRPGNELHVQLASFYMSSGNNGMPWGIWKPEYLPVAVRKKKTEIIDDAR